MELAKELEPYLLPDGLQNSDLHIQTAFSDGSDAPQRMLQAAALCGMSAAAVCDHLSGDRFCNNTDVDAYLLALNKAARAQDHLHVFKGVEVTLLNTREKALSAENRHLARFDLVMAEVSAHTKGIGTDAPSDRARLLDNVRKAYCTFCEHPLVTACSSVFALGTLIPRFGLDWLDTSLVEEIAAAFKETNTVFELNSSVWQRFPNLNETEMLVGYSTILETFRAKGVAMITGSGAHSAEGVANLTFAARLYSAVKV